MQALQTDPSAGTTGCYNTISGRSAQNVVDENPESVMIVSQGSRLLLLPIRWFVGLDGYVCLEYHVLKQPPAACCSASRAWARPPARRL